MKRPKVKEFLNTWFWVNFWNIVLNLGLNIVVPIAIVSSLFVTVMYMVELRDYNRGAAPHKMNVLSEDE